MLQKKSDFLEKNIDAEVAAAKKAGTKNKRGGNLLNYATLFLDVSYFVLLCYVSII